jgi:hypothetical protein
VRHRIILAVVSLRQLADGGLFADRRKTKPFTAILKKSGLA